MSKIHLLKFMSSVYVVSEKLEACVPAQTVFVWGSAGLT